ncbi:MAG: hypothetical protein HY362_03030 [Candidatus Aenigmarchaeota archaeon]|nr:hypothetical protein [Candidatus Aenigmarchaeota archaeon]
MSDRILLSIAHGRKELLDMVEQAIGLYAPKTLGLELPPSYEEMYRNGVDVSFLGPLSRYAKEGRIGVIPLDDEDLSACHLMLGMAKEELKGNNEIGKTRQRIAQIRANSKMLEHKRNYAAAYLGRRIDLAEKTLSALKELTREEALAEVGKEFKLKLSQQAIHARKIIEERAPDMVALIDQGANLLAPLIPDYTVVVVA